MRQYVQWAYEARGHQVCLLAWYLSLCTVCARLLPHTSAPAAVLPVFSITPQPGMLRSKTRVLRTKLHTSRCLLLSSLEQPPMDGSGQVAAEPFHTDPDGQRMFKAYIAAVVQRANSLTGVRYWYAGSGRRIS